MPAETTATYTFQPAERSIFSAKPSAKPNGSITLPINPKTINLQPLKIKIKNK